MNTYKLLINNGKGSNRFIYNYGNSKNIVISLSKDNAYIEFNTNNKYDLDNNGSYLYKLLKEGLKRIYLIHYIKYEKPLVINNIKLLFDSKEIDVKDCFTIYTLLDENVLRPIDDNLKDNEILQKFIIFNKTKYAEQTSALYSYVYSKTKEYEIEKFSYLWMSLNGFYNELYGNNDREGREKLLKSYGYGEKVPACKNRNSFNNKIIPYLNKEKDLFNKRNLLDKKSRLYKKLNELINIDGVSLTPYGYILCELPYYLRCNMFHGNKPLLLFCYEDDLELSLLKFCSKIIEDFLDSELYKIVCK